MEATTGEGNTRARTSRAARTNATRDSSGEIDGEPHDASASVSARVLPSSSSRWSTSRPTFSTTSKVFTGTTITRPERETAGAPTRRSDHRSSGVMGFRGMGSEVTPRR